VQNIKLYETEFASPLRRDNSVQSTALDLPVNDRKTKAVRTPDSAVRGRAPKPLDHEGVQNIKLYETEFASPLRRDNSVQSTALDVLFTLFYNKRYFNITERNLQMIMSII
jgi:hypothetical protein